MSLDIVLKPIAPLANQLNLQYLPAKLESTLDEEYGNVGIFFDGYTLTNKRGTKTNMLRGANVFGKPTPVPESLVGMVVVENKQKPMDEDAARTFIQTHSFEQYVLWNEYAQAMATGENLKKALEGYCHAEELHNTVDPIELQLFLISELPDETPSPATMSTTVSTVGSSSEHVDKHDRLDDFASLESRSLFTASPQTVSTSLSAGGSSGSRGSVHKLEHDDGDGGVVKMDVVEAEAQVEAEAEEEEEVGSGSD